MSAEQRIKQMGLTALPSGSAVILKAVVEVVA